MVIVKYKLVHTSRRRLYSSVSVRIGAALWGFVIFLMANEVLACSCARVSGDKDAVERMFSFADEVFSVEVVNTALVDSGRHPETQRAELRVLQSWKGSSQPGKVVTTLTVTACCACGLSLKPGEQWLMFVRGQEPFSLSDCSSIPLSKAAQDISILDSLAKAASKRTIKRTQ